MLLQKITHAKGSKVNQKLERVSPKINNEKQSFVLKLSARVANCSTTKIPKHYSKYLLKHI